MMADRLPPSSPAHTANGARKLIQTSGTEYPSQEGDGAPEVPCAAPRGRGRCRPGALGGHGRLQPGQSSLLLLLLAGRVSESWNGVWGRDRIPITPPCQLPVTLPCQVPITPLRQLWEERAESSLRWWQPRDQCTPRDILGLSSLILGKGRAAGGLTGCTPSAPSPWERSRAPKAGATHVMRAGRSLQSPTAASGGHPGSPPLLPLTPRGGGTWEPQVLPGRPGSESAAPGAGAWLSRAQAARGGGFALALTQPRINRRRLRVLPKPLFPSPNASVSQHPAQADMDSQDCPCATGKLALPSTSAPGCCGSWSIPAGSPTLPPAGLLRCPCCSHLGRAGC